MSPDCRVAVVGAGPQGLTASAFLVAAGVDPAEIVVIDPQGSWLATWHRRFAQLGIAHLRSPVVHHPHPDPYALSRYAVEHGRQAELVHRYSLPSSALFADFCDRIVADHDLGRHVVASSVDAVSADGTLELTSGETLCAQHVVWATDPSAPHLLMIGSRLREWDSADDATLPRQGTRVAIIGGGLTAAHLVDRAVGQGCVVHWVTRRPVRVSEFDTDPGWLGPKEMTRFARQSDHVVRLQLVQAARDGGSVPSWMMLRLAAPIETAQVVCHVGDVTCHEDGVVAVAGRRLDVDEVWPALGTSPSITASAPLDRLCRRLRVRRVGDRPVLDRRLRLGSSAVHVMGRLAQLELGPAAGNLAGARQGALRLVSDVAGSDAAYRMDGWA